MQANKYLLQVQHDKGKRWIATVATSEQSARDMVCKAENCPASAILKVELSKENVVMFTPEVKQQFLNELSELMKKYNVEFVFHVDSGSDTYGLHGECMRIVQNDSNEIIYEESGWFLTSPNF